MSRSSEPLDLDALRRARAGGLAGRALLYEEQVGSTNDIAREQARSGAPEGLLVLAEEQIRGRGRHGRGWAAPAGSSLLMSLLLRPTWLAPAEVFMLTMLAGVALCEAVEQLWALDARLKWPNDLLLPAPGGAPPYRKAAGILSELELSGDAIDWVVIGMGINVNWTPAGAVDGRDLALSATSLGASAGRPLDRGALLLALLERLDARYESLRLGRREELFLAWRARLAQLGQPIEVRQPDGVLRGVAEGVEPSGALRVRDARGELHVVLAGDVE